ncbi:MULTISPECIES: hypothetical protein [unclassified Kitasatospora]|uniref:hypothetical protein n=1 Tax=unclassified Kitasatospora TaxID=2633591 RepID=UPI0033FEE39E
MTTVNIQHLESLNDVDGAAQGRYGATTPSAPSPARRRSCDGAARGADLPGRGSIVDV